MKVEICAQSYTSALTAQRGGADRIELCAALPLGGTTPSHGTIKLTRDYLQIPICVLIRPRGGDFFYSDAEMEEIFHDIEFCKVIGVDGIVVGAQNLDGTLNLQLMKQMQVIAGPMEVICHRVFDQTPDPFVAMEQLIELGYTRILSSGQQPTAFEGRHLLAELIQKADNRITIMPGSGIHEANIVELLQVTRANEIHFTAQAPIEARVKNETTVDFLSNPSTNTSHYETNLARIQAIRNLLSN